MPTIALLTDFGPRDWFVASMKGVIQGINPNTAIIDITHEIPQGDVQSAAFCLLSCFRSFPKGTVFIVVVDPGVGSRRKAIVAKAEDYFFIAPDNGVISFILDQHRESVKAYLIEKEKYFRKPVSNTFHGRDIFAPVGAHISKGTSASHMGPKLAEWISLPWPPLEISKDTIAGSIIYVDHFGNSFTNISAQVLRKFNLDSTYVFINGKEAIPFCTSYNAAPEGTPLAIVNSADYVEIAVNNGSAAQNLNLSIGTPVVLKNI